MSREAREKRNLALVQKRLTMEMRDFEMALERAGDKGASYVYARKGINPNAPWHFCNVETKARAKRIATHLSVLTGRAPIIEGEPFCVWYVTTDASPEDLWLAANREGSDLYWYAAKNSVGDFY